MDSVVPRRYGRLRHAAVFKSRYDHDDRYVFNCPAGIVVAIEGNDVWPLGMRDYAKHIRAVGLDNVLPLSPLEELALQAE